MKTNFVTKQLGLTCLIMAMLVATVAVFAGCNDNKIKEISITTAPQKTVYLAGEKFDATGMVITVKYKNGTMEAIKFADNNNPSNEGYTYDLYKKNLTTEDKQVTFSYKNKKVILKITVTKRDVEAPKVEQITYVALNGALTVAKIDGAEYRLGATDWQDSNVFCGLSNGFEYDLFVRFKETDYYNASAETSVLKIVVMGTQDAISDSDFEVTTTETTITVKEIEGAEYKLDDGDWVTTNEFTGLTPNTLHTVYVRKAGTETLLPSNFTAKSVTTQNTYA